MRITQYSHAFELPSYPGVICLFTFLEQGVIFISKERYKDLVNNSFKNLEPDELLALNQIGALVNSKEHDYERLRYYFFKLPFANRIGRLTIVTTYECNMTCYYCLQNFMSDKDQRLEGVNLQILLEWLPSWIQGNSISEVELEFIGGEPLLNMIALKEICDRVRKTGVRYKGSLITNGSLLDSDLIDSLIEYGITNVQLTFDGPKDYHDKVKHLGLLESSYDTIREAISVLIEKGCSITLRINYPHKRSDLAIKTAESLGDIENKEKIILHFSELFDLGCGLNCDNHEMKHKEKKELFLTAKNLGFLLPFPFGSIMCKAEADCNYTITPNLEVYKCYLLLGNESAKVGILCKDGIIVQNYRELYRDFNINCIDCQYYPVCRGGCKVLTYLSSNDESGNTFHCPKKSLSKDIGEYLSLFIEANYHKQLETAFSKNGG